MCTTWKFTTGSEYNSLTCNQEIFSHSYLRLWYHMLESTTESDPRIIPTRQCLNRPRSNGVQNNKDLSLTQPKRLTWWARIAPTFMLCSPTINFWCVFFNCQKKNLSRSLVTRPSIAACLDPIALLSLHSPPWWLAPTYPPRSIVPCARYFVVRPHRWAKQLSSCSLYDPRTQKPDWNFLGCG
jgi:hypothetical protein